MARRKRTSPVLEKAERRAAGMAAIDPSLNLGKGLSLANFSTLIETMRSREMAYNGALSNLDKLYREMLDTEQELADLSEHMLLGVASHYGKSSVEYGMAGGIPKNQRRKKLRGAATNSIIESTNSVSTATSKNGNQPAMF